MQSAADDYDDSSIQTETEPDASTESETLDDRVRLYVSGIDLETEDVQVELVDPSNWFVDNDEVSFVEAVDHHPSRPCEERSPEITREFVSEIANDKMIVGAIEWVDSSAGDNADEMSDQVIDSAIVQPAETAGPERRKHHREASSHLVWVEYFDHSMQSAGKEAVRTENFGAGGMRVCVKAAPSGLERVRVSSSYRGFESHAIVRNRYPGRDGHDHLCLEFVDNEWKADLASVPVENSVEVIKPRKILFADDDPAFRKILGKILTRAGYDVVLAEDGESAVEKAATEKPDLVITDGLMPKLHGFLVCKAIKELNPPARVIMLTAVYTSPNYRWEARAKFGADEIITKPCEIADLLRSIERHLPSQSQYAF
jgi:CheY-like chemotaxis protein/microcompartment protein CcmK/EutM